MNKQHTKTTHTPTPWRVKFHNEYQSKGFAIYGANTIDNCPDCICEQMWSYIKPDIARILEANALHIVHCVNNHDLLIETLTTVLNRLEASGKFPSSVDLINQALSKESES